MKSNQGECDWHEFFASVSQQFAIMESIHLFDTFTLMQKLSAYKECIFALDEEAKKSCITAQHAAKKLNVIKRLEAYSNSLKIIDGRISENAFDGYALILVDTKKATVTTSLFEKSQNEAAEKEYVDAEKLAASDKDLVVALVSTTAVGGIKEAYPNYFADSTDFILHLACIVKVEIEPKRSFLSRLFG